MRNRPPSPYFRRIVAALEIASPVALAMHFEDGFNHCVEASISGAAALRRRKIKAEAIPCAILGAKADGDFFSVGLSAGDVYAILHPDKPFETWSAALPSPWISSGFHAHMVIEARLAGERAVIDLTYGQLRQAAGLDVPLHLFAFGEGGWPQARGSRWELTYMDSPHAEQIREDAKVWVGKGLTEDFDDMIDLALRCDCKLDRFLGVIQSQQPELFGVVMPRLTGFMQLGRMAAS